MNKARTTRVIRDGAVTVKVEGDDLCWNAPVTVTVGSTQVLRVSAKTASLIASAIGDCAMDEMANEGDY